MSSVIVSPIPFTSVGSSAIVAGSVANLNVDQPAMVCRLSLTSPYIIVDLGAGTLAYDYIALSGCNLRASDTVKISTGTTNTGTGNYAGAALAAYSGAKSDLSTTDAIYKLSSVRTERYVRIDLVATSHPDGYITAQRLIVGKAIVATGISYGAELSFVDQSVVTTGPGYYTVDEYPVLTAWNATVPFITETDWRGFWYPMLQWAGNRRAVLFIPDDSTPSNWQTDAIFGRLKTDAKGEAAGWNSWSWQGQIIELAP